MGPILYVQISRSTSRSAGRSRVLLPPASRMFCTLILLPHALRFHHHAAARPAATGMPSRTRITPLIRLMAEAGRVERPKERLQSLLLQCAIQAQLAHHNEFKNELQARWLSSFLGHEHLTVKRGSEHLTYRGVEGALRCESAEYLRTMLRSPLQAYEVRYKIGTPDLADQLDRGALDRQIESTGEEPAWASASASRRANPDLNKEPAERVFTEVIDPMMAARRWGGALEFGLRL